MSLDHPSGYHKIFIDHIIELGFDPSGAWETPLVGDYYDTLPIPPSIEFDLVFLDGPPGSMDRASHTAEAFIKSHLHEQSVVIQDDTHRVPEQELIDRLHGYLGRDRYEAWVIYDEIFPPRTSTVLTPRSL